MRNKDTDEIGVSKEFGKLLKELNRVLDRMGSFNNDKLETRAYNDLTESMYHITWAINDLTDVKNKLHMINELKMEDIEAKVAEQLTKTMK